MNRTSIPYGINRAASFVRDAIASDTYAKDGGLPPIRQLARAAGVSYVTMWKALKALEQDGALQTVPKPSIGLAVNAPNAVPSAMRRTAGRSVLRIKDRMGRDICAGMYEPGSRLPMLKQLKSRYGAAYRTISEALRLLCGEGVIRAFAKGYEIPRLSSLGSTAAIVFLADREYIDHYVAGIPQGHDYLRPLELEGAKNALRILVEECAWANDRIVLKNPAAILHAGADAHFTMLGIVYKMNDAPGSAGLLSQFKEQKIPVSILDESDSWKYQNQLANNPLVRIFPVGTGGMPGKTVGRYLLGLGHRHVAYISPYGSLSWTVARCQGLADVFNNAGEKISFTEYISNAATPLGKPPPSTVRSAKSGAKRKISTASDDLEREHMRMAYLQAAFAISDEFRRVLQPLFIRALSDNRITAWVTANDSVAVLAREFLQKKRVRVPDRISLVSFDDDQRAIAYKITSYNFNISAIVNAALRHIVDASTRAKRAGPVCEEIEGVIVERESAGRAYAVP